MNLSKLKGIRMLKIFNNILIKVIFLNLYQTNVCFKRFKSHENSSKNQIKLWVYNLY